MEKKKSKTPEVAKRIIPYCHTNTSTKSVIGIACTKNCDIRYQCGFTKSHYVING